MSTSSDKTSKYNARTAYRLLAMFLVICGLVISGPRSAPAAGQGAGPNGGLEQQAENGDPQAQFELGNMYLNGQGVSQDTNKALQWLTYAANNNHAQAQHSIGIMYFHGWHIPENTLSAKYWFEKAAQNGVEESVYYLQKPEFKSFVTMSNPTTQSTLHISIYGKVIPAH